MCRAWRLCCWSAVARTRVCSHRQHCCCGLLQPALYLSIWNLPLMISKDDDHMIFLYPCWERESRKERAPEKYCPDDLMIIHVCGRLCRWTTVKCWYDVTMTRLFYRSILCLFLLGTGEKNCETLNLWRGDAGAACELRCSHGQCGCSDLLTPSVWTRR